MKVHTLSPPAQINDLRADAFMTFLLLSSLDVLPAALVFSARAYVSRRRQYRRSLETKNEMLMIRARVRGSCARSLET